MPFPGLWVDTDLFYTTKAIFLGVEQVQCVSDLTPITTSAC